MLFAYPISSTDENWVHDCFVHALTNVHVAIEAGNGFSWPEILPANCRDRLERRPALQMSFRRYFDCLAPLSVADRERIRACIVQQNRIAQLCQGTENCDALDQLPPTSHAAITELFERGFGLLSELGIRDRHYAAIYGAVDYHICPFCGCEYFDAPGAPREDLDHYLARSKYPFAASNLRNLVPMGMRCNQRFKLDTDVLRDGDGNRRAIFDPYGDRSLSISLNDSVPFAGADGRMPQWVINFVPDTPECIAWDKIFSVRERLKRDVLDVSFARWLGEFALWFKKRIAEPNPSVDAVRSAMEVYADDLALLGLTPREFLRAAVFRMLKVRCANDGDRVSVFMVSLVSAQHL